MKRWITTVLCASVFFLFSVSLSHAQEQSSPQITVVQKVTHEDGTTSVVKKRLNSQAELEAYLEQNTLEGADVDLEIIVKDGRNIDMQFHNNHSTFEFSRDLEFNEEEFEIKMKGLEAEMKEFGQMSKEERFMRGYGSKNSNRAILGIYPKSDGKDGISISSTVNGSGSEAAGLQGGDIVIKVNETTTNNVSDLRSELNKFQPGQSVNVVYLRDGAEFNTVVVLSESSSNPSRTVRRDPCKVFIGVYVGGIGNQGEGVKVSGVIDETPASLSGVRKGDLIVALDDVFVNSHAELLRERNRHKPGDYFTLTVFRDGQELDIDAQFLECGDEQEEIIEEVEIEEVPGSDGGLNQPSIDINNNLKLEDYRAFPNPTYGEVNVSFTAEPVATDLQIVDASGKVIYEEDLPFFDGQYNKEIDLSNGTPGVIIINIRQGEKLVAKKVVLMARA